MPNRQPHDQHPALPVAPESAEIIDLKGRRLGFEPWLTQLEIDDVRQMLRERTQLHAELAMLRSVVEETHRAAQESQRQLHALRFGCPQARRALGDF